jgi:hypothetical protein
MGTPRYAGSATSKWVKYPELLERLRKLWGNPTTKPIAGEVAKVLCVSKSAIHSAVNKYGVKMAPEFEAQKSEARKQGANPVRKRAKTPSVHKPVYYGNKPTLPPLPSLQGRDIAE